MDYDEMISTLIKRRDQHELLLAVLNWARRACDVDSPESEWALDQLAEAVFEHDELFGPHEPTPCADCNTDTTPWEDGETTGPWEYYMVRNDLWKAATAGKPARWLCIGCLESRIGRELDRGDFITAPINEPDEMSSDRLRQRLTAPPR